KDASGVTADTTVPAAAAPQTAAPASADNSAATAPSATDATAAVQPGQSSTLVLQDGQIGATVTTQGSKLNVRSGPGTNYAIVASAAPQEEFLAVGRSADNS